MTLIEDLDLATYCGRIGNLYGRYALCPPFALRQAAQGWIARDIPLWHCVDVIERFLSRHAGNCYSGSGDWNFSWLNSLIQTTWHDRSFARPPGPASRRHDNYNHGSREPNQRSQRGASLTAAAPELDSKHDSSQPDRVGVRQKTAGAFSHARDNRSAFPQETRHRPRGAPKSSGPTPANPKKIDLAVAWLRTVLTAGERPAAEIEAEALCAGIAPRTLDRARTRLGVASRRIGFGRWAKYVIALPVVDGTPSQEANMAGAT
jgi:hypothetical protein